MLIVRLAVISYNSFTLARENGHRDHWEITDPKGFKHFKNDSAVDATHEFFPNSDEIRLGTLSRIIHLKEFLRCVRNTGYRT